MTADMTARDNGYPYGEFDAHKWAAEFDRLYPVERPRPDIDTMLGWFANAIMTGYDKAKNEPAARPSDDLTGAPPDETPLPDLIRQYRRETNPGRVLALWAAIETDIDTRHRIYMAALDRAAARPSDDLTGLDVERLAEAMREDALTMALIVDDYPVGDLDEYRPEAQRLAAAYEALR
jgi:hypothetical protein